MNNKVIGVDIGGTKCAVSIGVQNDAHVQILDKVQFATNNHLGVASVLAQLINNIEFILTKNKLITSDLSTIGISCGGPLDSVNGVLLSPPNLIGWDHVEIVKILQDKFKVTTKLQNDANACTLAEWQFGAAKGLDHVIFLTFGTGLGAGLILNKKLYSGANSMAGEVGHIRLSENGPVGYGKMGSFEGFCSGGGIAQLAQLKVLEQFQMGKSVSFCTHVNEIKNITAKDVAKAVYAGDALATEIYQICGEYLGKGLSVLIDILNPQLIVIGGIFYRNYELIWPSTHKILQKECLKLSLNAVQIVPAQLGEQIGDYAAIAVALYDE